MNRHQVLFEKYVEELNLASSMAIAWWQDLLTSEAKRIGSLEDAESQVRQRWPFGPTSHPYVIATYRKYFIACEKLNQEIESEEAEAVEVSIKREVLDEDWGTEDLDEVEKKQEQEKEEIDDDFWEEEGPIDPPIFLFDLLYGRYDSLAEFMTYFVFSCIGEEDDRSV